MGYTDVVDALCFHCVKVELAVFSWVFLHISSSCLPTGSAGCSQDLGGLMQVV